MSIFASRTEKVLPIPMDPPHEVTIRKLAGRHLEKARKEHQLASMAFVRRVGGVQTFRKEFAAASAEAGVATVSPPDPLQEFDWLTVLQSGVTAWTYEQPVTPEALEDLDEEAGTWLAREILALTLPNGDGKKNS